MKQRLLCLSLLCFASFQLFSQVIPEISIKSDSIACEGDTLSIHVEHANIGEEYNFVWNTNKHELNVIGDTIEIVVKNAIFSDSFKLFVKAYIEEESGTTILEDSIDIKIAKNPFLNGEISSFIVENDIFLEVPFAENEVFIWKSPNNKIVKGNIAKFSDVKLSDFGNFNLQIINEVSSCKSSFEHKVNQDEEKNNENVFGSYDQNEIPSNLFKEILRDVPVFESSITGKKISDTYLIAYPGYKYTIVGQIEEDYIVRFWKWDEEVKEKGEVKEEVKLKNPEMVPNLKISGNSVSGNAVDPSTKTPIIGATITESGTSNVTVTDIDGYFNLIVSKLPSNIEISYTGYQNTKINLPKSPSSEAYNYLPKDVVESINLNNKFVIKNRRYGSQDELRYFRLNKLDADSRTISFLPNKGISSYSFTAGTVLIPIKIRRLQDLGGNDNGFEFSKDITLGSFVGVKKRISKYKPYFVNTGLTLGISSVRITAGNSNPDRTPTVQDLAAFTWALGFVFEFDKVQVGLFTGTDRINNNFDTTNQAGYKWEYQNKFWWSLGFGYTLISRPQKGKTKNEEEFGAVN